MALYETLLVPHDFSAHSRAALDHAVRLAREHGAKLHLIHTLQPSPWIHAGAPAAGVVVPPDQTRWMEELRERADASLRDVMGQLAVPAEIHVVEGPPAAAICRLAAELGADLIVMGTHGRGGLAHAFLGSVAERTLREAPCPVLTLRAAEDDS